MDKVFLFFALMCTTWLRTFVVVQMWSWFVVPQFGVKALSLAMGYGLMVTIELFHPTPNYKKDASDSPAVMLLTSLVVSILILALGAITHSFI